ncbi:SPOR domain-containing protein [Roseobacter denitrificans]|uniref:SPOR domain-containing protein n=1 Tax=Roseobacter denitrificans (strain ATCC 33942 / OCh 114) TaxID=375451 RepID=Q164C2_ROSDO|nr:SPOR domain-containing protein [Roseobacter denitrificans]ABG32671.1 hypothetical protein RD1_3164 [Roseobacter denitrificans OCh 114]AVL52102.1 SPOR domain-containing protein [Roseobacter denitrificans]SFF93526.1 Sporulation related domain-containing protein [Roseobacter denitrificans OCh 114]
MADFQRSYHGGDYGHGAQGQDPAGAQSVSIATLTNLAGAVVSIALIAGIGVWGYKLMVRDVSGIPVVRAAEGEMRVRPEDPGGQLARHQGLAVNEIAARGSASGPVDRVVLAPPATELTDEDQPVITQRHAPVVQPEPLVAADKSLDTAAAGDVPATDRAQQVAIDAVVAELTGESSKVTQAPDALTPQPAVLVTEAIDAPGARASLRPRIRPADIQNTVQRVAYTPAQSVEVAAADIPSGTRLAQLGAFDSPQVARAEWTRIQAKFGEMLAGKSRVVQEVQSSGRTFYRLRAMGFVGLSDTRRFCAAIKAEGVDCIPVQVK